MSTIVYKRLPSNQQIKETIGKAGDLIYVTGKGVYLRTEYDGWVLMESVKEDAKVYCPKCGSVLVEDFMCEICNTHYDIEVKRRS